MILCNLAHCLVSTGPGPGSVAPPSHGPGGLSGGSPWPPPAHLLAAHAPPRRSSRALPCVAALCALSLPEHVGLAVPSPGLQVGVNHWFGIGKAQRQLGYEPVVSAEQGTRQMQLYWSAVRDKEVPRPGALGCIIILLGITLLGIVAYTPRHQLPWLLQQVQSLGLLVFFSREVLQTVFWAALGIHVVEGVVAYGIARKVEPANAVEWFLQTSLFGFWSLRLLLRRSSG